ERAIAAQKKSAKVSAVGVAQEPRFVVVFGKKQRGVGVLRRILVKELVHGAQEAFWLIESNGALAAQICLQIRHQKSSRNSLPGNITDHQSEPLAAEIEKIVIVTADMAG